MNHPAIPIPVIQLTVLAIVLVSGALALTYLATRRTSRPSDATKLPPFRATKTFLSPAERSFFGVLHQAVGTDYHIFAKVRLADIVMPESNGSRSAWQSAFNRIALKHVDFLLCDRAELSAIAAIELDDKTHSSLAAGIRDDLVDAALRDAQIPVLRLVARHAYSPSELRSTIKQATTRPAIAARL